MNKSIPPFYVGQRVVVIKDHSRGIIKRGKEFTILSIDKGCRHSPWMVDIGVVIPEANSECPTCKMQAPGIWFCSSLFDAITEDFQSITFKEVIKVESPLTCVN